MRSQGLINHEGTLSCMALYCGNLDVRGDIASQRDDRDLVALRCGSSFHAPENVVHVLPVDLVTFGQRAFPMTAATHP